MGTVSTRELNFGNFIVPMRPHPIPGADGKEFGSECPQCNSAISEATTVLSQIGAPGERGTPYPGCVS